MVNPQFQLGLCFSDMNTFRDAVKQHAVINGRDIKFSKNEKNRVQAVCKHECCPWNVYASNMRDEATLQIKTIHAVHECNRKEKVACATSNWLANKYQDKLRSDPNWPVDSMMSVAQKDCKLLFSRHQVYRAKKKATEMNTGSSVEQYGLVWRYAEEIRRCSPNTTIRIKTRDDGGKLKFKRIYLCWGALKQGFLEGCRPIIFLDGCHLKSSYGGILLSAVGIDANNGIYPFAYAVVEKEKRDSWVWFMELLKTDLEIENCGLWTIMSDKQKGLVDAVDMVMPNCEHRFCVMHLYCNFKLSHRGLALKNILWQAARASRVVDFDKVLRELAAKDKKTFQWLAKRPAAHWSRAYFSCNSKCDTLLNNMCESFNALILRPRTLSIIDMLEAIRMILMKRIHVKRDKMAKYGGEICPNIQKQLDVSKEKAMEFIAHWNGKDQFELEGCFGSKFKVNLGDKTCSCRRWQLSGIPCAHAIAGMFHMGYLPESYVDNFYRKETYLRVYNHLMDTLDGHESWPQSGKPKLLPPDIEKMPGRPKLNTRRKQPGEANGPKDIPAATSKGIAKIGKLGRQGVIMTCSHCQEKRHNAKGCPLRKASGIGQVPTTTKRKRKEKKTDVGTSGVESFMPTATKSSGVETVKPTVVPTRTKLPVTRRGRGKRPVDKVQGGLRLLDEEDDEMHIPTFQSTFGSDLQFENNADSDLHIDLDLIDEVYAELKMPPAENNDVNKMQNESEVHIESNVEIEENAPTKRTCKKKQSQPPTKGPNKSLGIPKARTPRRPFFSSKNAAPSTLGSSQQSQPPVQSKNASDKGKAVVGSTQQSRNSNVTDKSAVGSNFKHSTILSSSQQSYPLTHFQPMKAMMIDIYNKKLTMPSTQQSNT